MKFLVAAFFCVSATASTLSPSDVRSLYADLFTLSAKQTVVVRPLPAEHPLAVLSRDHEHLLAFLLTNYSDIDFPVQDLTASIRKSDRLASVLLPLAAAILQERGDTVEGIRPLRARSIPLSELTRIAVRFFYVDDIAPDGKARARICAGVNGLVDAPFARDPLLEAIAYSAILRDWQSDRTVMHDFTRTLRQLREMSLSNARAAMWAEMSKSAPLADILRKEVARTSRVSRVSLRS